MLHRKRYNYIHHHGGSFRLRYATAKENLQKFDYNFARVGFCMCAPVTEDVKSCLVIKKLNNRHHFWFQMGHINIEVVSVQKEPTGCTNYFQFISIINFYIFRGGLLLVIRRYSSVYTTNGIFIVPPDDEQQACSKRMEVKY